MHFVLQLQRQPPPIPEKIAYWNLDDLRNDLDKVEKPWIVLDTGSPVTLGITEGMFVKLHVAISEDLRVTVALNSLPLNEPFWAKYQKLRGLLKHILHLRPCEGITNPDLQLLAPLPSDSTKPYYQHVTYQFSDGQMTNTSTVRSRSCSGQAGHESTCKSCAETEKLLKMRLVREKTSVNQPINLKTPLQSVARKRLVAAFKEKRKAVLRLEREKAAILNKLETESVAVSDSLHSSLKGIIKNETILSPFLKLFWSEQEKAFNRQKGGMRWHPMMVRFAILIHTQSPSVYRTLRETGALRLPGESTLRDYTNSVLPHEGFTEEVIGDIKRATVSFKDHQRWVVLLQDEMSIKSDLVHDQATGEVVGFVDSSAWQSDTPSEKDIASHVLVLMVVGVNTHLKMCLGYFPTRSATAEYLYPIFWRAVCILEMQCGLKVSPLFLRYSYNLVQTKR